MDRKLPLKYENSIFDVDTNIIYEVKVDSIRELEAGVYGNINFWKKDFSEGIEPVTVKRYLDDSYHGTPLSDWLVDSDNKVTNYKEVLSKRIKKVTGVDLTESEMVELFGPLEREILDPK